MTKRFWVIVLFCITLFWAAGALADEMTVLFFNAGSADACLITTTNSTVLIDTGKNKFGKEIVSYLEQNGIDQIDVLVITHYDKDHVGGADKVLESVNVRQVIEPDYVSDSKQFAQYREATDAAGTEVITLSQNASFELDGVSYQIDVANSDYYGEDEENDFSLVISARYGETSFLFAGDAENPRLSELISEGVGRHNVLKVPHHGKSEKLSAAFFAAVKPEYSIITSDEKEPEETIVVDLLSRHGQVYLTRLGNVKCTSNGKTITVVQE